MTEYETAKIEAIKGYQDQRLSIIEKMNNLSATYCKYDKTLAQLREDRDLIDQIIREILFENNRQLSE